MKRKSPSKVQPIPVEAQKPLPVRQLKAMRRFGIRQLSAALEMVGVGEQFVDQSLALGFALKIRKEQLSSAQLSDIMMAGAEYLLSRGILELAPPPKPKHGDVDVVIRAPTTHTALIEELIAAGLKARTMGLDGLITEFKGRLPRDSGLPDKVKSCHGTVAFIENPHVPDTPATPGTGNDGEQDKRDAETTIGPPMTIAVEPPVSQACNESTAPSSETESSGEAPSSDRADAITVDRPSAHEAVTRPGAYVSEKREIAPADINRFSRPR